MPQSAQRRLSSCFSSADRIALCRSFCCALTLSLSLRTMAGGGLQHLQGRRRHGSGGGPDAGPEGGVSQAAVQHNACMAAGISICRAPTAPVPVGWAATVRRLQLTAPRGAAWAVGSSAVTVEQRGREAERPAGSGGDAPTLCWVPGRPLPPRVSTAAGGQRSAATGGEGEQAGSQGDGGGAKRRAWGLAGGPRLAIVAGSWCKLRWKGEIGQTRLLLPEAQQGSPCRPARACGPMAPFIASGTVSCARCSSNRGPSAMQAALAVPTPALARPRPALPPRRLLLVRSNKPLREFREDTGEVSTSGGAESGSGASGSGAAQEKQQGQPKYIYADEQPVRGGAKPVEGWLAVGCSCESVLSPFAHPSPAANTRLRMLLRRCCSVPTCFRCHASCFQHKHVRLPWPCPCSPLVTP